MVDSFGATMRALRHQQDISLDRLADQTQFSKGFLSNVEAGRRAPNDSLAAACDRLFGSAPLMTVLLSIERGDAVKRRALLGGLSAAGVAALIAADGTAALAAVLDRGLRDAVAQPRDWDALAADFARRHVLAPGDAFGAELAAQLSIAQHYVGLGDRDAARGAALLALTYGLWLGDSGRIPTANGLYTTAAHLADRSGHDPTRALVRARAANRGIYEGWAPDQVTDAVVRALRISDVGMAGLEAHAALAHMAGLSGDLEGGRRAVAAMRKVADTMEPVQGPSPAQRVASFHNFVECRAGSTEDAYLAYGQAEAALHQVPLWGADASLYMCRALVASGVVAPGIELALETVEALPFAVRVLGIGVRDVLSVLPRGYRDDNVDRLRLYASPGPAPWGTLT